MKRHGIARERRSWAVMTKAGENQTSREKAKLERVLILVRDEPLI